MTANQAQIYCFFTNNKIFIATFAGEIEIREDRFECLQPRTKNAKKL